MQNHGVFLTMHLCYRTSGRGNISRRPYQKTANKRGLNLNRIYIGAPKNNMFIEICSGAQRLLRNNTAQKPSSKIVYGSGVSLLISYLEILRTASFCGSEQFVSSGVRLNPCPPASNSRQILAPPRKQSCDNSYSFALEACVLIVWPDDCLCY
jgi:hypothetical protein